MKIIIKTNYIAICLLISLAFLNINSTQSSGSIYKVIGELALKSEDQIENSKPLNLESKNLFNHLFGASGADSKKIAFPSLSQLEKLKVVYSIFDKNDNKAYNNEIISLESIKQLNTVCGSPQSLDYNLLNCIDKTNTAFGKATLSAMLSNPTKNIDILKKRQAFLKELVNNNHLFKEYEKALKSIKENEDFLIYLWHKNNPLENDQVQKLLYFQSNALNALNKSPLAQNICNWTTKGLIALGTGFQLYQAKEQVKGIKNINEAIDRSNNQRTKDYLKKQRSKIIALSVASNAINGVMINKGIQENLNIDSVIDKVNEFMKKLNQIYNSLDEINKLPSNSLLKSNNKLTSLFNETEISKELKDVTSYFKSNSFIENSFSQKLFNGYIKTSYKILTEHKNDLLPSLEALGEIDALFSIAKLIIEHKNLKQKYCFVNFLNDKESPIIDFIDGWNPIVKSINTQTESIKFGKNNNYINNMLLTGPNGSGKSSFMRELAYIILLGQTFGIAPAEECNLTIFSKILTYIGITEDYSTELSNYMNQKNVIKNIEKTIENLNHNEFSLSIIDEMFSGTRAEVAEDDICNFANKISNFNNSICLLSTHFTKPIELERETGNKFINYYLKTNENSTGFIRLFKLSKGIPSWWYSKDKASIEKRKRYISQLS